MTKIPSDVSTQPHPRWSAEKPGERHPKSAEAWDWRQDRAPNGPSLSYARLSVATDYDDPRAPDQMALVLRIDLMRIMGDYIRLLAWQDMERQQRVDAAEAPHALADIAAERRRQVEVEGWTPDHDDSHKSQDMALAAACYAAGSTFERPLNAQERRDLRTRAKFSKGIWPWDKRWWKPSDRRRDLVKAGALIVAEIERMDRLAAASGTPVTGGE